MATVILVISNNKDTGAQILLSHLLLVIKFNTVAIAEKVTTNQIAESANEFQSVNTIPALLNTIEASNARMMIWKKVDIRITGGYFPGNFPPIAKSPQGIPAAKAS